MSVSGGSVTEATISSLMSSTTYSIQVAAVNSAGTGVYSDVIVHPDSKYIYLCFSFIIFCGIRTYLFCGDYPNFIVQVYMSVLMIESSLIMAMW